MGMDSLEFARLFKDFIFLNSSCFKPFFLLLFWFINKIILSFRWKKQCDPVPATFTFAWLNTSSKESFLLDVWTQSRELSLDAPTSVSRNDLFDSSLGLPQDRHVCFLILNYPALLLNIVGQV